MSNRNDPNGWISIAENIRNTTHNLVITEKNDLDNPFYFDNLKEFVGTIEASKNYAYMDGIKDPKTGKWMSAADPFGIKLLPM